MIVKNVETGKRALKKNALRFILSALATLLLLFICFRLSALTAHASPGVTINLAAGDDSEGTLGVLELMFMLLLITLAPSILVMMTSFTRIVIVLSFLRNAMGTQQAPSNQIVVGIALFMTLFIMQPVFTEINETAYQPYRSGAISQEQAVQAGIKPLKVFMLKQTYPEALDLYLNISGNEQSLDGIEGEGPERLTVLGLEVIVPAFLTSELKRAFEIGFLLFLPFLIIDMVVASTLMSMGMVMLPPSMISLPFKIMMFVIVDGWELLLGTLAQSFR